MNRHRYLPAVMALALLAGSIALPAYAQDRAAPPTAAASTQPHPWASLDPAQRELLAPLQPRWDTLPPHKQAHMLERAAHWATLPAPRREKVRERIARWQQMTPAQREQARANLRTYRQLPPDQRQRLHAAYEHFQQLPPAQRDQLLREWRAQTIEQRLHGLDHPNTSGTSPPTHPPGGPASIEPM